MGSNSDELLQRIYDKLVKLQETLNQRDIIREQRRHTVASAASRDKARRAKTEGKHQRTCGAFCRTLGNGKIERAHLKRKIVMVDTGWKTDQRGGHVKLNGSEAIMNSDKYGFGKVTVQDRRTERLPVNPRHYGSENGGVRESLVRGADGEPINRRSQAVLYDEHDRRRYHETEHGGAHKRESLIGVGRETRLSHSSAAELEYWLECFERHCSANHIAASEKIQVAYHNLQGPAGSRIKELWDRKAPRTWEEFKSLIFQKPEPRDIEGGYRDTRERAAPNWYQGIRQESSVREYRNRFEALCLNTSHLPGRHWEDIFLLGLKPQLRNAVKQFQPKEIIQMMDLAQWLEEDAEIRSQASTREQGNNPREFMKMKLVDQVGIQGKDTSCPFDESSLRFQGFLGNHEVSIEIDSGATHNFLSMDLASKLSLHNKVTKYQARYSSKAWK
ncbi:unnamed protein product [Microthlaspi erraticum]|uniref:Retrotransposon gag domain-containing protein n=1 Tax=Microthlaspi erraticum TaxID=1685480 RepID=A0A6D2IGD7_9BRAS|nr:unnamed protein product [Microthlaspi erraticum]